MPLDEKEEEFDEMIGVAGGDPKKVRSVGLALTLGSFIGVVLGIVSMYTCGCQTPAILIDPNPGKCGEWPVWCTSGPDALCCWEGNTCTPHGCEYNGSNVDLGAHLDAGAGE